MGFWESNLHMCVSMMFYLCFSLVRSLMSDDGKADLSHGEDITDGKTMS